MKQRVGITSYAAIPAILALAGAAFVMKPEEMRRNPLLEMQGMVGLAPKYEVMFARCAQSAVETQIEAAHFAGGFSQQFPARSDEDAAHFVQEARPQCDVASLYRLERPETGSTRTHPYRRTRIEI